MSVLVSKSRNSYRGFSKELFTEVSDNLKVVSDEEWEVNKECYKSITFSVYIRTDVDNLVLMLDDGKFAEVFKAPPAVVESGVYPLMLVDSGYLCGKSLFDKVFSVKSSEALKRLAMKSMCYPVGAIETSKNYVLAYNVVISSDLLKDTELSLNKGFCFRPIETLELSDSLQREIAESLVIVKIKE